MGNPCDLTEKRFIEKPPNLALPKTSTTNTAAKRAHAKLTAARNMYGYFTRKVWLGIIFGE